MMRRLLAGLFVLSASVLGGTDAGGARPNWISGCYAWKHSTNHYGYSARCSSGNARYVARAWCSLPGSGRWDYGSYVWPGTTSTGYCNSNEIASNVGWTQ